MEKVGFEAAMVELREKGLEVGEVVTDAHLDIGALMSKNLSVLLQLYTFLFWVLNTYIYKTNVSW